MIWSWRLALGLAMLSLVSTSGGCLALSFGGKSTEIVHECSEVRNRVASLEARVQALEQQAYGPATSPSQPPEIVR